MKFIQEILRKLLSVLKVQKKKKQKIADEKQKNGLVIVRQKKENQRIKIKKKK